MTAPNPDAIIILPSISEGENSGQICEDALDINNKVFNTDCLNHKYRFLHSFTVCANPLSI